MLVGGGCFRGKEGVCADWKAAGGASETLRLLQEAGLGGQRHEGWGQALQAHAGAKVEVRGGE